MYAKLYQQVLSSSLTEKEPIEVRGVFFMLMAAADKSGNVLGSDKTIARIINVPLEQFVDCLKELMKPDPDSGTKDYEGRRVVPLEDGRGYNLPSYAKYSGITTDEQRREYFRVKQAECRARKRESEEPLPLPSAIPLEPSQARAKFTKPTLEELQLEMAKAGMPEFKAQEFLNHYETVGWVVGKARSPMKNWRTAVGTWKAKWEQDGRPMPPPPTRSKALP